MKTVKQGHKADEIDSYLDYHQLAWAPATLRSARYTLTSYWPLAASPEALWTALAPLAPYTRQTVWIRLSHYQNWLVSTKGVICEEANSLSAFAKRNKRLFRGAYKPERLTITYEEAVKRLAALQPLDVRRTAQRMLFGAQRWSDKACGDGIVVGKGSKVRQDYSPGDLQGADAPYQKVYRALKAVGLKPHTLRKLALNLLVERGATAADLMQVAGWASMATAVAYLQPKDDKRLKEMLAMPTETNGVSL